MCDEHRFTLFTRYVMIWMFQVISYLGNVVDNFY